MALLSYPSGLSYFVFGCVMLSVGGQVSTGSYLVQLLILNAIVIAIAEAKIGYPWQALVRMPAVT